MHLKHFRASTLDEALARVRAEFGPDALVLSTRRVRRDAGIFGLLGRPVVEVVAAVEREARRGTPAAPESPADPSWTGLSLNRALLEPIEAELLALRSSVQRLTDTTSAEALARDLGAVRHAVTQLAAASGPQDSDPRLAARLVAAGLARRHALALADEAERLAPGDGASALRTALGTRLDRHLQLPRDDECDRVTLAVGAPGVGKTTTLAKLATRGDWGRSRLAIVTTDVHRAGGANALREFSSSHDIPFASAATPAELAECVRRLGRRRPILVDTAGRSSADGAGLAELSQYREALGKRAQVQLVLSANTKEDDARAEVERFRSLRPEALVVTKVDDTRSLAGIGNLMLDDAMPPLVWLGDGQRVPDDLRLPDPEDLAGRVLGGAA